MVHKSCKQGTVATDEGKGLNETGHSVFFILFFPFWKQYFTHVRKCSVECEAEERTGEMKKDHGQDDGKWKQDLTATQ